MAHELSESFAKCRPALLAVGFLSGVSNVLALTGAIFMLAVYDRVIPSGSVPSLVVLGVLALAMYVMQAVFDILRGRILARVGLALRESLSLRVYDIVVRHAAQGKASTSRAVRDLDQIQSYLSSMGPAALFDLPWLPIYLAICFAFHPLVGFAVLAGALVLIGLTAIGSYMTKGVSSELGEAVAKRDMVLGASQGNAETLQAMGMTASVASIWSDANKHITDRSQRIADISSTLTTSSRVFRMVLQSFVLAVGAYLVISGEATGGIMIAGSILSARALAPIELTIAHWKNLQGARLSWKRLKVLFEGNPAETGSFAAPVPRDSFACQGVSIAVPGLGRSVVRDVSFTMKAGEGLGIIGPTGSGKSSLARGLVGLWPPVSGNIRLDGMDLGRWPSTERGRFIGYLPQKVSLFKGTIAQNISRFDSRTDADMVISVARTAGVHDMICRLPNGYDTRITPEGGGLSGGQAQRIGLARALYGDPFLVVLDEPNANLDAEGEIALCAAIDGVRERGGVVVTITHRPSVLASLESILVLTGGRVRMYGERAEVLRAYAGSTTAQTARPPLPQRAEETIALEQGQVQNGR